MSHMMGKITVGFDRAIGRHSYKVHRFMYKKSGGWIGHRSLGGPMLLLTSIGRKSGQERTNPLLYMPDGPNFVVVGSNGGRPQPPAWILNLTANPAVSLQVGRRKCQADAHFLDADERAEMWPRLNAHFKGWSQYQQITDRELKVVSLVPRQ
jgi:deazaflavin-dependent oxidoreductase (nitroreductase family)